MHKTGARTIETKTRIFDLCDAISVVQSGVITCLAPPPPPTPSLDNTHKRARHVFAVYACHGRRRARDEMVKKKGSPRDASYLQIVTISGAAVAHSSVKRAEKNGGRGRCGCCGHTNVKGAEFSGGSAFWDFSIGCTRAVFSPHIFPLAPQLSSKRSRRVSGDSAGFV